MSMFEKRVEEAIEAIKKGERIIMIDNEDRENEGDLVYAATFSTPALVNLMAKEGRGLICVTLSKEIANRLELNPMVAQNSESFETAFTISVDSKNTHTGISAFERDQTIKILANPLSCPNELVRPGHIFPIIAREGGVLVRTGHTEGSVDLCRLAGVAPVAVICEVMKDDGTMARRDDLKTFAQKHNLKTIYISDLVAYRLKHEALVHKIKDESIGVLGSNVQHLCFEDHKGRLCDLFIYGKVEQVCNLKVWHKMDAAYIFGHRLKDFIKVHEHFTKEGGVVMFLQNETTQEAHFKNFGIGAQILHQIGAKNINLCTENDQQNFIALEGFGLKINAMVKL